MRYLFTTLLMLSIFAGGLLDAVQAEHGRKDSPPVDERTLPQEQQENYRVFARVCSRCHGSGQALRHHADTPQEWEKVVDRMVSNGARLNKDERTRVLAFLAYHTEAARK